MPRTPAEIRAHAERWIEAWNSRDLDRIMDQYAADVEFEANTVATRWRKPDGKLFGNAELRRHFGVGFELAPAVHFTMEEVFSTTSGYAVLYRRENGNRVLNMAELDADGRAKRVKVLYVAERA